MHTMIIIFINKGRKWKNILRKYVCIYVNKSQTYFSNQEFCHFLPSFMSLTIVTYIYLTRYIHTYAVCFRAGGTGGAGGALAPPVFWGERPINHLDIALSMAAIHRAPPDFSTSRRPCFYRKL